MFCPSLGTVLSALLIVGLGIGALFHTMILVEGFHIVFLIAVGGVLVIALLTASMVTSQQDYTTTASR